MAGKTELSAKQLHRAIIWTMQWMVHCANHNEPEMRDRLREHMECLLCAQEMRLVDMVSIAGCDTPEDT